MSAIGKSGNEVVAKFESYFIFLYQRNLMHKFNTSLDTSIKVHDFTMVTYSSIFLKELKIKIYE